MMMAPAPISPTSPMSIPPLSSSFRPPSNHHHHHHQQQLQQHQMQHHSNIGAHQAIDPFGAEHPMLSISYRVPPLAHTLHSSPGLALPHSSLSHPLAMAHPHSASSSAPPPPSFLGPSRRPSITPTTTTTSADLMFAAQFQHAHAAAQRQFDPSMDYPGLYHYAPADIKHRKRTTREQLKILEETYAKDQKPNAALRKSLSEDLQMTPRGVQVWFQNRRAKDKANMKKAMAIAAEEATTASSKAKLPDSESKEKDTGKSNTAAPTARPAEPEHLSSPSTPEMESPSPPKEATSPSPHLQPPTLPAHAQRRGSAPNLIGIGSPSKLSELPVRIAPEAIPPSKQRLGGPGLTLEQIHNIRRGSMPVSVLATMRQQALQQTTAQPPPMLNVDPMGRRRSLDPTQTLRLSQHPYAGHVLNNNSMTGSPGLLGRRSSGMFLNQEFSPELNEQQRRSLMHRPSMQYGMRSAPLGDIAIHQRTTSGPVNPMLASRNYPLVPRRSNLPYAFPPRVMEQPSSGPLPAPDFSFGSAVAQPVEEGDEEESISPTSFDSYRRFGSFASAADSDTSASVVSAFSRFGSIAGSEHLGMEAGNMSEETSPGQEQFRARFSGLEVKQDGAMPSSSSAAFTLFAARTANQARPQIKLAGAYPFAGDYGMASTSAHPDIAVGLVTPTAAQFEYGPPEGGIYSSLSPSISSASSSSSSSLGLPMNPSCSPSNMYDQQLNMPVPEHRQTHLSPADLAPLPFTFDLQHGSYPQLQDLDGQLGYNPNETLLPPANHCFTPTNYDGSPLNMEQVPTLTSALTSEWPQITTHHMSRTS